MQERREQKHSRRRVDQDGREGGNSIRPAKEEENEMVVELELTNLEYPLEYVEAGLHRYLKNPKISVSYLLLWKNNDPLHQDTSRRDKEAIWRETVLCPGHIRVGKENISPILRKCPDMVHKLSDAGPPYVELQDSTHVFQMQKIGTRCGRVPPR